MASKAVQVQQTERRINGQRFYPVHLTNEEIRLLISSVLERTDLVDNTHYQVYIRKDKTGKGLDFRLQNSKGMYAKRQLITFSISPMWQVNDLLIHRELTQLYGKHRIVDVFYSEDETTVEPFGVPEIDSIFITRLQKPELPYHNLLLERDDWVCVMEKNDVLADTPYTD